MFERIKTKILNILKEKKVSLAMIYNREGEILWHTGRKIKGRTIKEGEGFSKTHIFETLKNQKFLEKDNIVITSRDHGLPRSAITLQVKGLMIIPFSDNYYLYVDSGKKETFNQLDRQIFKFLGELLGDTIEQIKHTERQPGGISGLSAEINSIRDLVIQYAVEENPVLLLGETGVGKSHIAALIHQYSGRRGHFTTINTPSIPDNLFESEIFGHKKGAFTDAHIDKAGFIDEAEGGTLFFDEISEVPLSFQAKLLRFIETYKYNKLGDPKEKKANVRIVAATNKNLKQAIKNKEFRDDLYYRLQVLEIRIPPLRNRRQDIRPLIQNNIKLLKGKTMGQGFWEVMENYDWPGNVRELITVLTRAGIIFKSPITGKDIKFILDPEPVSIDFRDPSGEKEKALQKIRNGANFWQAIWEPFIRRDYNRALVKKILEEIYNQSACNFKTMIKHLNLKAQEYHNFMTLMHKYDIDPRT